VIPFIDGKTQRTGALGDLIEMGGMAHVTPCPRMTTVARISRS
jgi:hypothetical protein